MANTEDSKERVLYLNILRIAATGFVIILHCISKYIIDVEYFDTGTWWVCNIINSAARTGVPLFFMISGYLLLNNPKTLDIAKFYKKRFSRILIPFFIWDIIYYLYNGSLANEVSFRGFFKELFVTGSSYHLWFVYTLAGIYLIIPFLKRIVDNCSLMQLVLFLFIITFTSTIRPFFNTVTPFYVFLFEPLMEGYVGYIILGYILGKYKTSGKTAIIIYLGGVAGALIGIIGNRLSSTPEIINLRFNGGYQLNHFLLAAAIFVLAKQLNSIKNSRINTFALSISSVTYSVYLAHVLVLELLKDHVRVTYPLLNIFINFIITFLICTSVMLVIGRIKRYLYKLNEQGKKTI